MAARPQQRAEGEGEQRNGGQVRDTGAVLSLRRVGRRYGWRGPWVLREVDLELGRGDLVRVQGVNGSGKSTLLRLLAGIDAPSTGRLTGRPRTAYVPERFPASLPFTAGDYLTHLARVHGLRGPEAGRRAALWLERLGAGEHLRTPMALLSKGTSQKVALAQAFTGDPDLLVLDEAWTGLDRASRDTVDQAVTALVRQGATAVFVDHDPARLADAVDTELLVTDGRVVRPDRAAPDAGPVAVLLVRPPTPVRDLHALAAALPGRPGVAHRKAGGLRLTVPATHSDDVLRALLNRTPAWHVEEVTPPGPPRAGAPHQPADARSTDPTDTRGTVPAEAPDTAPTDEETHR
ncbi:ATP-binding cassette domain-containing protein [Streptomyces sp. NPDC059740]|uniref:ABC transporter ATP-binding protein n=1 Tax=Streptomyces sp. NPDC059740 TaxID=3346926 RepID=UPI0036498A83